MILNYINIPSKDLGPNSSEEKDIDDDEETTTEGQLVENEFFMSQYIPLLFKNIEYASYMAIAVSSQFKSLFNIT